MTRKLIWLVIDYEKKLIGYHKNGNTRTQIIVIINIKQNEVPTFCVNMLIVLFCGEGDFSTNNMYMISL